MCMRDREREREEGEKGEGNTNIPQHCPQRLETLLPSITPKSMGVLVPKYYHHSPLKGTDTAWQNG